MQVHAGKNEEKYISGNHKYPYFYQAVFVQHWWSLSCKSLCQTKQCRTKQQQKITEPLSFTIPDPASEKVNLSLANIHKIFGQ